MRRQNRFRGVHRSVPDRRFNEGGNWIRASRSLTVDYFNALGKFRPAFKTMLTCDHQLRISQCKLADIKFRFGKLFKTWMVSFNAANRFHIRGAISFQQFPGLFFVLLQAGMGGQRLGGHQRPSFRGYACWVRMNQAERKFALNFYVRWARPFPRTGCALSRSSPA